MFSTQTCPYCGNTDCSAEWCDVGVGFVQCGPYHCLQCNASEIGPFDKASPSDVEKTTGWYVPGRVSEHVSTISGQIISSDVALAMYKQGLVTQVPFHI